MMNRIEAAIACALLCGGLGWAYAGSFPNTLEVCTKAPGATCPIPVRVEPASGAGGCSAVVEIDRVRANSTVAVVWYLAKTSMSDTNQYEFVGNGIQWTQAASAAQDFQHQAASSVPTRTQWLAASQAMPRPFLDYKPVVRILNKTVNCSTADPKINNDGP